jgi:hypothetical protein
MISEIKSAIYDHIIESTPVKLITYLPHDTHMTLYLPVMRMDRFSTDELVSTFKFHDDFIYYEGKGISYYKFAYCGDVLDNATDLVHASIKKAFYKYDQIGSIHNQITEVNNINLSRVIKFYNLPIAEDALINELYMRYNCTLCEKCNQWHRYKCGTMTCKID